MFQHRDNARLAGPRGGIALFEVIVTRFGCPGNCLASFSVPLIHYIKAFLHKHFHHIALIRWQRRYRRHNILMSSGTSLCVISRAYFRIPLPNGLMVRTGSLPPAFQPETGRYFNMKLRLQLTQYFFVAAKIMPG